MHTEKQKHKITVATKNLFESHLQQLIKNYIDRRNEENANSPNKIEPESFQRGLDFDISWLANVSKSLFTKNISVWEKEVALILNTENEVNTKKKYNAFSKNLSIDFKMKKVIYHTIQCTCIVNQFKRRTNPPLHEFFVFSVIENDILYESFVACNNCGLIHKVTDLNTSTITGKEDSPRVKQLDDIKLMIPKNVIEIIAKYDLPKHIYEHILYIYEEKAWGERILLQSEIEEKYIYCKYLKFNNFDNFLIQNESHQLYF